jgi:predicted nucleic acid-binding protein
VGEIRTGATAAANPSRGLTDTDILVDALRAVAAGRQFLAQQQATSEVQISIISAMELVVGCRNAQELSQLQRLLRGSRIVPATPAVSRRAYGLITAFFLSHRLLIADALIAATALELGLTLYTRNVRDFQMIPGLVVRPY